MLLVRRSMTCTKPLTLAALLFVSTVLGFGCNAATNAVDCNSICDRYQTCFDASYDTSSCESRCRSDANSDPNYMDQSDACSSCITDKSCASATFTCGGDCAGIVP